MNRHLIAVFAVVLMMLATSATALAGGKDNPRKELRAARAATADFRRIDEAFRAGYGGPMHLPLADKKGFTCIDNLPAGGMGIHYVNGDLVSDSKVNARTPDVLVYEPRKNGKLRLVALEYVVFQAAWDAENTSPPSLFGQEFELLDADNRYGLDPFYELHAWVWKNNPAGMFDDWNPRVSCRYA
jgi:hypothetical protein